MKPREWRNTKDRSCGKEGGGDQIERQPLNKYTGPSNRFRIL